MKEATGEVSMTVITLVAIGVIGAIIALFWPKISNTISGIFDTMENQCASDEYESVDGTCVKIDE